MTLENLNMFIPGMGRRIQTCMIDMELVFKLCTPPLRQVSMKSLSGRLESKNLIIISLI